MAFSVIGYVAGTLTTLSFVPQVVRAWRTRHTDDLAWGWLLIFQIGLALWLIYGLILRDWSIILANFLTLALCVVLVVLKAKALRAAIASKLSRAQAGD